MNGYSYPSEKHHHHEPDEDPFAPKSGKIFQAFDAFRTFPQATVPLPHSKLKNAHLRMLQPKPNPNTPPAPPVAANGPSPCP